ncbi:hypothetical protein BH11ACT8_BH11ACT8_12360 [soil metagenome]
MSAEPAAVADARIEAVLAVLRGASLDAVSRQWSVDPHLLQRWVTTFIDAGTAKVVNRPDPRAALQRDRFLAAFAYEMRSPLSVALGWGSLLTDEEGIQPAASFLQTVDRLQVALGELADRVADVELLVAAALGGLHVERAAVPVRDVCDLPGLRGIGGEGPDFELRVDPDLFARIMRDLWGAAVLDPQPDSLRIDAVVREPWVELRVLRGGRPIDTDVLQALFEPFEFDRLSTGITTGLYLARALTVAHGGTIGVDQDDDGAVFWVRVPLRPPATAP